MPAGFVDAPILDLRARLHWRQRLSGRLSTGLLWFGSISLLGPLKLAGVLVASSLVLPPALLLQRARRHSPPPLQVPLLALTHPPAPGLPRALVAAQLGLSESLLFRARHASVCTVHHDEQGCIASLAFPVPVPAPVVLNSSSDAHPVG